MQPYEFLTVKVAQKYFFDRDFGGALTPGRRNQFYPINTLSGFTFGGRARSFSLAHVAVRYRPLASVFADLRMDIGSDDEALRNMTVSAGVSNDKVTLSASYYLSRRIDLAPNSFEPGTFPGSQVVTTFSSGTHRAGVIWRDRQRLRFHGPPRHARHRLEREDAKLPQLHRPPVGLLRGAVQLQRV